MMDEFFNKIEKMFGNNNDSESTPVGNSGTGTINDEVLRIPGEMHTGHENPN